MNMKGRFVLQDHGRIQQGVKFQIQRVRLIAVNLQEEGVNGVQGLQRNLPAAGEKLPVDGAVVVDHGDLRKIKAAPGTYFLAGKRAGPVRVGHRLPKLIKERGRRKRLLRDPQVDGNRPALHGHGAFQGRVIPVADHIGTQRL